MSLPELTNTISGTFGVVGLVIFMIFAFLLALLALLWLLLPIILYVKLHRLTAAQKKTNELLIILTQKR